MKKRIVFAALFVMTILLIVGCSGKKVEEKTVSIQIHWDEEAFEKNFNQHIKKALPHIKLEYIQANGKEAVEENFSKGLVPDIVLGSNFLMYQELDLVRDQMPLVEEYGLDLSLYDQGILESLRNASVEGELNALPVYRPGYVMAYNKDIFDAFGVPYPTDHMTWDEVIEVAKKLTGEKDGRVYYGLWPARSEALSQVGATIVDPETNEPNILENQDLRIFLERQQTIFNIPGNLPEMDSTQELAEFIFNGTGNADPIFDFAFFPGRDQTNGVTYREAENGLDFDWVTYPTWGGDYPEYHPNDLYNNMFVTSQAKDPEVAFEVLAYLMSEEYQKWAVSIGNSTVLLNKDVYAEFGKGLDHAEVLETKNTDALFKIPGAPIPAKSRFEGPIFKELIINAYKRLLDGDDINTVIRVMDEEATALIADLEGKE